jgi:RES domain-containing protein
METYRLTRKKRSNILSGKGAAIKGARWNSQGVEVIYTALNRSLAMAEVAVHFSLATMPDDYMVMTIFIPDDINVKTVLDKDLPEGWNSFPYSTSTQKIGDDFIMENKYCTLKVPSVVTKGDYNILINPYHSDFNRIKIVNTEEFPFDIRIFK